MSQLEQRTRVRVPVKNVQLTDAQIHTALNTIDTAGDFNGITTIAQLDLQRVLRAALRQP